MRLHSVAPKELIRADFEVLKSYERLDTTPEIQELLFIQSLEGRAHNGSGVFNKRTYVNTSIDDVVHALDLNPDRVKARRQTLVDSIAEFALATLHGEKKDRLTTPSGEPILGIRLFQDRRVNARDILRGLYIGGLRDNPEVRKEAERIYQTKIGGGRCYIIDARKMIEMNLDGERLAHEPHEDEIDEFTRLGLILDTEGLLDADHKRYFYIRHRLGPGQSDDMAMILAGILYNPDVAIGVFLADAIDTLEKYAPVFQDQDGALSYKIGRGFQELKVTMEDVYELSALAAIPEAEEHRVPDSSLRYLLAIDQRSQSCAFKTHLDFIEGRPVIPLAVSFKQVLSTQFYEFIKRRLINVKKFEKLALPNLTIRELELPAMDLAKKDFTVLPKEATLEDVIRKFKETKSELIILQDKNNKAVGTISPTDLLYFLDNTGNGNGHARN